MASNVRPSLFERHPRATLLVLVTVLLVGCDLAFTAAFRALVPPPPPSGLRVRDPVVHHGLKPLFSGRERWGPWDATYHTSSLGLRDASARVLPLEGTTPRVLLIGDSFTEGIGVDWEETFAGRLSAALAPEGVEVLNAGAASYCPIIYERRVRQLLEKGLRFDHLVVYVDVGDILDEVSYKHDAEGNVVGRETRRIQEERANRAYEGSILALTPLERFLERRTTAGHAAYAAFLRSRGQGWRRGAAWTLDPAVFESYGKEGLQRAARHMEKLAATLAARGIRLTVAVYPWPDHVLAGDVDSRQARFWRTWSEAHGAGFLDYFPRFVPVGGEGAEAVVRRLFIRGDIHWNADGHREIAAGFLEAWPRLRQQGPPAPPAAASR